MIINNQPVKSSDIIREQNTSNSQHIVNIEPSDTVILPLSCLSDENGIISYSSERIAQVKEQMEKEGFKFNDEGRACAIISSTGDNKLIEAERAVTKYGGKITGSLWLIDSFTAEITPEAYCFLFEKMPGYNPKPDVYDEVLQPFACKSVLSPNQALADFASKFSHL